MANVTMLLVLGLLEPAHANPSARRAPGHSYRAYFEATRARVPHRSFGKMSRSTSVVEHARPFVGTAALRPAPAWSGEGLARRFRLVRDTRALSSPARPDFARRATWLYPDDGCYARAAWAVGLLAAHEPAAPPPAKIFVFGDLTVRTENTASGRIEWWYHVAPLVRVDSIAYVIDPAIDPSGPLTVDQWLARQTRTPESVQVAVCGSGTYAPDDRCDRVTDGREASAARDEAELLEAEWSRLVELGRRPEVELGDNPPWPL